MSMWFIGDTHFNHANIIDYCNRPFSSVEEMDKVMIDNWNSVVQDSDIVYFLGDFVFGDYRKYLSVLKGEVIFIKGNHDREKSKLLREQKTHDSLFISIEGVNFELVHDPADRISTDRWLIYGHHHNNYSVEFPFFDSVGKKINVSVEMINYFPVNSRYILNKICGAK